MSSAFRKTKTELQVLLKLAEQRLGAECAPFDLDWCLQTALQQAAPRPQHFGFGQWLAIREWECGSDGHTLQFGFAHYRVKIGPRTVSALLARYPQTIGDQRRVVSLWICPVADYAALYRFLRRGASHDTDVGPPLMSHDEQQRLWDNTIGFLQKGQRIWDEFQVPVRRGVMLSGEPGNGKTMAARWLRAEASKHGFDWKTVSGEEYDAARTTGGLQPLLALDEPGLVFLDDFDRGLERRDQVGVTQDHSALLSALDGMDTPRGVVYVFTSNLTITQLDPAIRRPGRIDSFIPFARPTSDLRRRFFLEYWPEPLRTSVPVQEAVAATEGCSFAEIDEVKKLMILHQLDTGEWNWQHAWSQFRERFRATSPRTPIGFAAVAREQRVTEHVTAPPATKLSGD